MNIDLRFKADRNLVEKFNKENPDVCRTVERRVETMDQVDREEGIYFIYES